MALRWPQLTLRLNHSQWTTLKRPWLTLKLNLTTFCGAWGFTAVSTRVCSSFNSCKHSHRSRDLSPPISVRPVTTRGVTVTRVKLKVNRLKEAPPLSYGTLPTVRAHSVTCHLTQVNAPHLNPSQASWYSVDLSRWDGRLSWPRWLATYQNVLPARRRSPIQVLTGPDVVFCQGRSSFTQ